jgi:hypothetical protein
VLETILDRGFVFVLVACIVFGAETGFQVFRHAWLRVPATPRSWVTSAAAYCSAVLVAGGALAIAYVNDGRWIFLGYLLATSALVADVRACRRPHPVPLVALVGGVPSLALVWS